MSTSPDPHRRSDDQAALASRSWRGGARIDLQNATYPYATLSVSSEQLELSVSQMAYRFSPHQVRAIEEVRVIPLIGRGIRIHHDVVGYPQLILFWTRGNPSAVAGELRQYGYGTDPNATFEPTDFPAERAVFPVFAVFGIIFLTFFLVIALVFGFCIISALFGG